MQPRAGHKRKTCHLALNRRLKRSVTDSLTSIPHCLSFDGNAPCSLTGQFPRGPVERMAVDQDDALAAADIVICKLHRECVERDRRRTPGYTPPRRMRQRIAGSALRRRQQRG